MDTVYSLHMSSIKVTSIRNYLVSRIRKSSYHTVQYSTVVSN